MSTTEDDFRNRAAEWAERQPRVRRLWMFGSRAKGNPRPDSDLDIAVEIEPVPDSEETLPYWITCWERWQSELQRKTEYPVDLDWFDPDGSTQQVAQGLREGSILLYDRAIERPEAPAA